jgi:hypothetical protein
MIFGRHPTSYTVALISQSAGTPIPSNTDSDLSDLNPFDGDASTYIRSYPSDHCIVAGKDWGAGKSKVINRVKVQGVVDGGFCSSGFNPTDIYVYLFGANTAPSFSIDSAGKSQGNVLMTYGPFTDTSDTSGVDITTAMASFILTPYRYHWVGVWSATFSYDMYISELNFWEILFA